ncbi:MAG TPA: TIGR02147 family protein [Bacteriovoracaceae bacterium]|nr:TIGR02147 family protein [Bacteriovoracaceae bacterium]
MKSISDVLKTDEVSARLLIESPDYRTFLKNFFKIKKVHNTTYSYAVFARQAGVSKSLPRDIIEGLKRITEKTLPAFLHAMELEGLIEELFVQLVAAEDNPARNKLVQRLSSLFIETYYTKTYSDSNFKDFKAPFLYAASGEVGVGVDLKTLSKRTGLSLETVKSSIPTLETLKLGKYDPEKEFFIPSTAQVHVVNNKDEKFFHEFYLYCLNLQRDYAKDLFHADDTFFFNEVFSINKKDIPSLKTDLIKLLQSFLIKAENSKGDSVSVLNLGLFRQAFKD